MSKRTWSVLLLVTAAASLLIFTGWPNEPAVDGSGGGAFSFLGELKAINAKDDSFEMGDGTYGPNPTVTQTISYNFKISKTEITNSQFQQFMDDGGYSNDSYWTTNGLSQRNSGGWTEPLDWSNASYNGSSQPVVGVSWYEAVAFSNWLSVKEGLTPAYNILGQANLVASGYRLPTEVEWEYAAAKGASGLGERLYAYGSTWDCDKVVGSVSPCGSYSQTANVGSKSPAGDTPQGLADMSGNVWELCSDNYEADGSVAGGTNRYNFVDDQTTTRFVLRGGARGYDGGAWYSPFEYFFRAAFRRSSSPYFRLSIIGFRVIRP